MNQSFNVNKFTHEALYNEWVGATVTFDGVGVPLGSAVNLLNVGLGNHEYIVTRTQGSLTDVFTFHVNVLPSYWFEFIGDGATVNPSRIARFHNDSPDTITVEFSTESSMLGVETNLGTDNVIDVPAGGTHDVQLDLYTAPGYVVAPGQVPIGTIKATFGDASGVLLAQYSGRTLVYSNGPLLTGVDVSTGNNISVLESVTLGLSVFGFGAQATVPNRLADQFAVCSTLTIDEIELFGYATGVASPVLTNVQLSLYDGNPSTGTPNQLIPGAGSGVNLISTPPAGVAVGPSTFTGIYRVLETSLNATNRPIHSVRVAVNPPLVLTPGIYWLEFAYTGYNFCPPVTTRGQATTGDGIQLQTATYFNVVSGPAPGFGQGIPFNFYSSSPITPPGAITNLGGGCSAASLAVRGSPAVGGYVRAEVTNVNPLAFGAIILGVADPAVPWALFGCGCVQHASLDALMLGNSTALTMPVSPTLCGAILYIQGAQLAPIGGITACNVFGIQADLTDGFEYRLW